MHTIDYILLSCISVLGIFGTLLIASSIIRWLSFAIHPKHHSRKKTRCFRQ